MSSADISFGCAWALVDELSRGGVRHACVSPGSRSTPLSLALSRHPGISVHVHLDERSSAFFALGLAKATRERVVVASTSGTAAAELFPAVVEGWQSRVGLILLTADRPPRLRGTGANQTIDQVDLYGRYVRRYRELPVPTGPEDEGAWRDAASDALSASDPRATGGPVHLNCPFDEPLTPGRPSERSLSPASRPMDSGASPQARLAVSPASRTDLDGAVERFFAEFHVTDGVVLAGTMHSEAAGAVRRMATELQWPLIAEPTSRARGSARWTHPVVMSAGALILEERRWLGRQPPGVVLQVGALPTSPAAQDLARTAERLIVMDEGFPDPDPDGAAIWRPGPAAQDLCSTIADAHPEAHAPSRWLARWNTADDAVRAAVDGLLDRWSEPSEMRVARDVAATVPVGTGHEAAADPFGGTLFVGNSMPVRDLDAFMAPREGLRVLANRGASGIDGLVSTALGAAASGTGPTVALLGDLSFLYDAGSVLWNARRGIDLVVVVNDNAGGQIFAGLGQRELPPDELERLFVTPHDVDLALLCAAAGAVHTAVERADDLNPAVASACAAGGLQVVRVAIDAERDRARRAEIRAAVAAALDALDPR